MNKDRQPEPLPVIPPSGITAHFAEFWHILKCIYWTALGALCGIASIVGIMLFIPALECLITGKPFFN